MAIDFSITAPVATLIGAAIAGTVAAVGWRVQRKDRIGDWESIKLDLEIANLLDDDDPRAKWLREYARIRLEAYAIDEVSGKPRWDRIRQPALLLAWGLAASIATSLFTASDYREGNWVMFGFGMGALALLAMAAGFLTREIRRQYRLRSYKTPRAADPAVLSPQIERLRQEIKAISDSGRS